ncbi:hypothetical protein ACG7TL_004140 [Trametes sanguinea]
MSSANAKLGTSRLYDVEGWVCVVTGGGTGIGLMIAQAFANNGARVYITSRRPEVLKQAAETWGKSLLNPRGQIIPVPADVTDKKSIEHLVNEVSKNEKHVDVLVNNAGVSLGTSTVEKGDESAQALKEQLWNEELSDWETVYRTNVIRRVYFFTTAAFLPLLSAAAREGHTGSVINVSSMSGITRTSQHHFKYNVSKAATIHLNTLLAQELRRPGVKVRVNSIAPGIFPSEMTVGESDDKNKSHMEVPPDYGEKKGIPAGRPGRDEDMAQTALYIASNEYLYGQDPGAIPWHQSPQPIYIQSTMISCFVATYKWLVSLFTTRTTQGGSRASPSTSDDTDCTAFNLLFILALIVLNCRSVQSSLMLASLAPLLATKSNWSAVLYAENGYLSSYVPFVTAGAWILVPVLVASSVTASTYRTLSARAPTSGAHSTSSPQPSASSSEHSTDVSPAASAHSSDQPQSFANCLVRRILTGSGPVTADPALVDDFKAKIQQLIELSKKWKENSANMETRARASEARYRQTQRELACKELALAQKERRHEELRIMLIIIRSQEQQAMANLQTQVVQARSEHRVTQNELSDTRAQLEETRAQLQEARSTLQATRTQQSNAGQRVSAPALGDARTATLTTMQAANDANIQELHERVAAYSGRIQQLQESVDRAMAERDEHEGNAQAYAEETDRLQCANIELENLLAELEGYRAWFSEQQKERHTAEQELSVRADVSGGQIGTEEPAASAFAPQPITPVDVPTILITSPSSQWCVRHVIEYYDDASLCAENVVTRLESMGTQNPLPLPSILPLAKTEATANEALAGRRRTHHRIRTAPTPLDTDYEEELEVEEYLAHETDYTPAQYSSSWLFQSRIPVLKRPVCPPSPPQPESRAIKAALPSAIPRLKQSASSSLEWATPPRDASPKKTTGHKRNVKTCGR